MTTMGPVVHHSFGPQQFDQPPMGSWYHQDPYACRQPFVYGCPAQHGTAYPPFAAQLPQYHQQHFPQFHPMFTRPWINPVHVDRNFRRPSLQGQPAVPPSPSAAVPDAPRGPPRKPKQSGHAVWIGNLPVNTSIHDLKDYCARGATEEIESVFLISKSNCAFANFSSHAACEVAISRFQNSSFQGRRLVCRLRIRQNSSSSSLTPSSDSSPSEASSSSTVRSDSVTTTPESGNDVMPLIVRSDSPAKSDSSSRLGSARKTSVDSDVSFSHVVAKVPERYFIVKSLTVQDLVASVNNGTWEAQEHIESILHHAFDNAENIYLIFSANKSGEYFGFARMTSNMYTKQEQERLPVTVSSDGLPDEPQSIQTPANGVAPRGKIYDDSVRGTVFWEVDHSASPEVDCPPEVEQLAPGKQFNIEWLSTSRVQFYRTRGLRNPWNGFKEVKIARDGTELEPNVGRLLAGLFRSG